MVHTSSWANLGFDNRPKLCFRQKGGGWQTVLCSFKLREGNTKNAFTTLFFLFLFVALRAVVTERCAMTSTSKERRQ